MNSYEIRYLAADGRTILLYVTQCADDDAAMQTVARLKEIDCARYELWSGFRKVTEGPCETAGAVA